MQAKLISLASFLMLMVAIGTIVGITSCAPANDNNGDPFRSDNETNKELEKKQQESNQEKLDELFGKDLDEIFKEDTNKKDLPSNSYTDQIMDQAKKMYDKLEEFKKRWSGTTKTPVIL